MCMHVREMAWLHASSRHDVSGNERLLVLAARLDGGFRAFACRAA